MLALQRWCVDEKRQKEVNRLKVGRVLRMGIGGERVQGRGEGLKRRCMYEALQKDADRFTSGGGGRREQAPHPSLPCPPKLFSLRPALQLQA